MDDKLKYISKSLLKINGIIHELTEQPRGCIEVVIVKKGKKERYVRFIAYPQVAETIRGKFKVKDRIKIRFLPYSNKNYQGTWNTYLLIYEALEWHINEDKLKRQEYEAKRLRDHDEGKEHTGTLNSFGFTNPANS